ncbi:MAG: HesB/IscA family protein [Alphaproteobacteria bacterium]
MAKSIIDISDEAANQIRKLINEQSVPPIGIKVSVKSGGCSGLSYDMSWAEEVSKYDEVVSDKGVSVIIDPKAVMYLMGSTLVFIQDKMKEGFDFINPNAKNSCGCGKSFNV